MPNSSKLVVGSRQSARIDWTQAPSFSFAMLLPTTLVAGDESPKYNEYHGPSEVMSEEVSQKLQGLRNRAGRIAEECPPRSSSGSALTKAVEGAVGGGASRFVASEGIDWLVPGRTASSAARKFVRNSAREADKKALEAWNNTCQVAVDQLLKDAKDILSTLSIICPSLTVDGNSGKLVRKLNVIYRYKRPPSMAKALVAVLDEMSTLDLIPNEDIELRLAEQHVRHENEANVIVANLERSLRKCVEANLAKVCPNWWEERVPHDVRKRAEKRRNMDEKVSPRVAERGDLMAYVGFSDYLKIISSDKNWPCFEGIFGDKVWLSVKLGELEHVRNALMHSRNLTKHGVEKLRVNSADIIGKLRGIL